MLDTFAMQQSGSQYRRLIGAFQRIFGATIFFGTDSQRERAAVVHQARFNFMSEARIWYSRDPNQKLLPGDCQNVIVLRADATIDSHWSNRIVPGRQSRVSFETKTADLLWIG
jgi:hypothetical protein